MFSARWAHRTLVGICVFIVLGVVGYAGWEGWLGRPIQDWIGGILGPLLSRVPNPEILDRIARVLGAAGTALTAAYGVYKGIYYADHNLPERLRQLLRRTDERLQHDRQLLLAAVTEARAGVRVRPSVFYVDPLNRALGEIGFPDLDAADKSLREALRRIQEQIELSISQVRNMEEQKVAAHILRGSISSARAEYNARSGASIDADRHAAEDEFDKALILRPSDLDARELRGRQRELRLNVVGALDDYELLAKLAMDATDGFRASRAYRLQGELLERHATAQAALNEASRRFDAALKAINTIGSLKQNQLFEKGLLLKAYGRVQLAKGRKPSAKSHLKNALGSFKLLKTPEAAGHVNEIEQMLSALEPSNDVTTAPKADEKDGWLRRLFG